MTGKGSSGYSAEKGTQSWLEFNQVKKSTNQEEKKREKTPVILAVT